MTRASWNVLPIRLGSNVLYVLRGRERVLCIDAGPDYEGAWEDLISQLRAHGLAPRDVYRIYLTHGHLDHAGLAARWQESGALIAAGMDDAAMVAAGPEEQVLLRHARIEELRHHGVPDAWLDSNRPARTAGGGLTEHRRSGWPGPLRMTPVSVDLPLGPSFVTQLGGIELGFHTCPGHTPGTIVVHARFADGEQVFTGDHLLPRQVATVGIQVRDGHRWHSMPAYMASLRWLQGFDGLRASPGHGEEIPRAGDAISWSLSYLSRRSDRLLRYLSDQPNTAFALAVRCYPHLTREHMGAVMAETIGLLDVLEDEGVAAPKRIDGGVIGYRRLPRMS